MSSVNVNLPSTLRVIAADTDLCPVDLGAYSSRVTFMVGNATIDAARKLRKKIVAAVADSWGLEDASRVWMGQGEVFDTQDPERKLSTMQAFQLAEAKYDTLGSTGAYNTPTLGGDYRGGTIGASPAYSFTAPVVDLSVDEETEYVPGKPPTSSDLYMAGYDEAYAVNSDPGYYTTNTRYRVETALYSARDGMVVWLVHSETVNPDSVEEVIQSVSSSVAKKMKADGLVH